MIDKDRSVSLAELAARVQTAPQSKQRSACRNPECVNGLTPGLAAAGGGSKAQPLFGAGGVGAKRLMKWSWVSCLACNAPDDARKIGAAYKNLNLSEDEIARRSQLATTKAPYQPPQRETLSRPPTATFSQPGQPRYPPTPMETDKQLTELLEQNKQLNERLAEMLKQNIAMTETLSRMSMQVATLLEDNAKMRLELTKPSGFKTSETVYGVGVTTAVEAK